MEAILNNPFVVLTAIFLLFAVSVVLIFIYIPRAEEIARLRRIIDEQHARIDQLSKESTAAELQHQKTVDQMMGEYIADIGELTSELAATSGRAAQNASRAKQIAKAKDERRGAA